MSKYQFNESDIYLSGTDIPRNQLGITDPDLLHEVERTLLQQAYRLFIADLDLSVRFDKDYFKGTSKNPDFIPTAALREKFLANISIHMRRCEIFPTPCTWANSEFLEVPSNRCTRKYSKPCMTGLAHTAA